MSSVIVLRTTASAAILLIALLMISAAGAAEFATSETAKKLVAGGAKITTMSVVEREARKYGFKLSGGGASKYKCGVVACYCEGASDCADLIKSNKCSDDFHCAGNDQGPACVCTQE